MVVLSQQSFPHHTVISAAASLTRSGLFREAVQSGAVRVSSVSVLIISPAKYFKLILPWVAAQRREAGC